MFKLFIDLELNKHDFLEYSIQSTKKFLRRHKQLFEIENLILNHVKTLVYEKDVKELSKKYLDFKLSMEKPSIHSSLELFSDYFDINAWLEAKLCGKKMLEIIIAARTYTTY